MSTAESTERAATDLFNEVGNILEYLRVGDDLTALHPRSHAATRLVAHCRGGRSLSEAFFLVCEEPDAHLGCLLFGSIKPYYDTEAQEMIASERDRALRVNLCLSGEPPQISSPRTPNTVILCTDFRSFTFLRTDEVGQVSRPFAVFNADEMCEEIAFVGSIWASIYPTHYAIVSRTLSYTFPQGTGDAVFSTKLDAVDNLLDEERAAYSRLNRLDSIFTQFLSLEALCVEMQSCSRSPKLLSEHKEGAYTLRRYSPQRSSLFDFGKPAGKLSRGDFVTTYNVGREEFHREFFISPRRWEYYEEELQLAAFDILHMLAIRRAKLFRIGFASHVYNVVCPPVLLMDSHGSSDSYALFPCLNLYRTSRQGFRRTLSLTFIACPVEVLLSEGNRTGIGSRPASLEELHQLKDDLLLPIVTPSTSTNLRRYAISGPIRTYLELPDECAIPELLQHISKSILQRIVGSQNDPTIENLVDNALFTSSLESRIATMLLQVEWTPPEGFTQPWERWVATGDDKVFRNSLFRTLFYKDYLDPQFADASRHATQFEELNIGNTLGADMAGMTLYNPQDAVKFVLYPKTYERYPNHSIVRWMAWQVYIDSALTALRALLYRFHPIVEDRGDLHSIIYTLDEMIQEFVDFYDLDIRDYSYRKEYERARTLMQVDADYAQLLSKFASSKEDESLREQRLINKLILSLTIATVTVTVVSTIAQIGVLDVFSYLMIALTLSTVMVWLGYMIFDPLRHGYQSAYRKIRRLWR